MSAVVFAVCSRPVRSIVHCTRFRYRYYSSLTQLQMKQINQMIQEGDLDLDPRNRILKDIEDQTKETKIYTSTYPGFARTIQSVFPGSMLLSEYFFHVNAMTTSLGFVRENTMAMAALCRDEIVQPATDEVLKYYEQSFYCNSLAGSITFGTTGLAAALQHCPIDDKDGKHRFVFVALPHIAISAKGDIGACRRRGITEETSACGALNAIAQQLKSGQRLDAQLDIDDLEMSVLRMRVKKELKEGDKPGLDELTKIVCGMVTKDVKQLLRENVDLNTFEYVAVTGVQIHGPDGVDWVCHNTSWHGSNKYENKQRQLTLPTT